MFNALVFLAVNAHSHTTYQVPSTEVNVVKETFYKQKWCEIQTKKHFALRKTFSKDEQTDFFKPSMKTKVRQGHPLERLEALLCVAAPVYKSSWWEGWKTLKRLEQLIFRCYFKNVVFRNPLISRLQIIESIYHFFNLRGKRILKVHYPPLSFRLCWLINTGLWQTFIRMHFRWDSFIKMHFRWGWWYTFIYISDYLLWY